MGNYGSPTCTTVYGGAGEGSVGWLLGEPNEGLQAILVMVNVAQFNVGAESLAMSERAYQLAYARERRQGHLPGPCGEAVPIIRYPTYAYSVPDRGHTGARLSDFGGSQSGCASSKRGGAT